MNERRGTKGLELWCRKMTEGYPGVKIDNMTTSWRDGLAFCAIIHHFRPDLIDFSKLNKNDVYHNNELAFRIAEQYLGIPALLEPEDMVEYTVPDRLSILTYLSQFYQAFAVREGASPARIAPKRPQSTTDHGIVSPASTSPPTKVVTKGPSLGREPCTKCGLPVFIAERLNVGKSLFHRTCFRCARCNSQLTLSNYYETESNEYCCEICPDEEKVMAKTTAQKALLQRSMSDEEKSASLKVVISNEPDEFSAMFENALENADIEKAQTLTREFNSARSNFFQSQIVESSDSGNEEEDKPPDLPQSLPQTTQNSLQYDSGFPSKDVSVKVSFSDNLESQNVVTKESVVKARMRLFENDLKADVHSKKVPLSPNASIPSSIKRVDNSISENKKDTKYSKREEFKTSSGKEKFTSSISLKLNIDDDTDVNTKDSTSIDDKPKETSIEDPIILSDSSLNDSSIVDKPEETSVISIKDPSDSFINEIATTEISVITIEDSIEDSKSKIEEAIEAINSITSPQESSISNTGSPEKSSYLEDMSESNSRTSVQDSLEQNDFSFIDEVIEPIKETTETINYNVKDPIEEQISPDDKIIETINYRLKESDKNTVEAINERIKETFDQEQPVLQIEDNSITKSINDSSLLIIERKESYPDDLNPFDDEKINDSLNPFGSDDEKDELNPFENDLKKPQPSPRFKKKILDASHCRQIMQSEIKKNNIERVSINPFDSDEDDKRPVPVTRKKKISAPRISLEPWSDDENVPRNSRTSSRLSELKHKEPHSLSTSGYNFGGSNSSISSGSYYGSARKKRPAPKPPIPAFVDGSNPSSLASTPSHSVQHSPKTTPKYRKEKRAPPPPKLITSTPNPEEKIELSVPMESSKSQDELHKEKIVKDEVNRNRQSQDLQINEDSDQVSIGNKSTYGKWKRKKGLAPAKPIPQKRILKCLPMAEIKKELEFIEIQQQGLEKQGVRLEQIIREKCEGTENNATDKPEDDIPIEVEDLILQLFELVNEKNELFRKQTELMYLRRQQRLEEEHADVEYQIRCLMMQPEANKTDSDKAREEELIKRLVDIVERRNEIVECLEKDRVREAEEDDSINNHINLFTLNRDIQSDKSKSISEPPKKEKKKKEKKSKRKSKDKIDVDKDIDETETSINTLEKKKKKKFNLF